MSGPQRLVPLTLGWQQLDRSVALDGFPTGTADLIPVPGWVIELGGGGLVVFDTGFDPTAVVENYGDDDAAYAEDEQY